MVKIKRPDLEKDSQSLVKIGQTRSNLIDGSETTILFEIHI